jgi:hypothetical protein
VENLLHKKLTCMEKKFYPFEEYLLKKSVMLEEEKKGS